MKQRKKKQLFCFEFLFAISFFLCSFLTPLIYTFLDDYNSRMFLGNSNKVYIVCMMGYLFYLLGLTIFNKNTEDTSELKAFVFTTKTINCINIICFLLIILFFINGGRELVTLYSDIGNVDDLNNRLGTWGQYLSYVIYAYTASIVLNFSCETIDNRNVKTFLLSLKPLFILNSLLFLVPLMLSGYRSVLLQVIIPIVFMYSIRVKRIKTVYLFIILALGLVLLEIIGFTRSGDSVSDYSQEGVSLVRDFIPANGANSFLIDYADRNGPTGGTNMLLSILSIIPFLQSIVIWFTGPDFFEISSSAFFTNELGTWSGLGTSIIGDLYYTFGVLGVVILMFLYGYVLRLLYHYKNPYGLVMLIVFTGNAIFAPRVEYCHMIRSMAWSAFVLFIAISLTKGGRFRKKHFIN